MITFMSNLLQKQLSRLRALDEEVIFKTSYNLILLKCYSKIYFLNETFLFGETYNSEYCVFFCWTVVCFLRNDVKHYGLYF